MILHEAKLGAISFSECPQKVFQLYFIPFVISLIIYKVQFIIYLHVNVKYKLRLEHSRYTTWEGQWIDVMRGKFLNKPLYINNIYRPLIQNVEFYNQFINEFASYSCQSLKQ